MKLVAQVKLLPDSNQVQLLKLTLEAANAACNYISARGWENKTLRQFPLHKLTYRDVRDRFPLTAQVVVRCIAKVADAYKIDRKMMREFKLDGAIAYDNRILSYNLEKMEVSIWTIEGRRRIKFTAGKRQMELLKGQRGESDLCLVKRKFYLLATCDVETPKPIDVEGVLGVDLGIVNIASDSDGENFSGSDIDRNRRIFSHRRARLQKKVQSPPSANSRSCRGSRHAFKNRLTTRSANVSLKRRKTLNGLSLWKI
ncbi:MAG: RNA-guided endonuclease TnpB family protein [Anaerolineales bacterium]